MTNLKLLEEKISLRNEMLKFLISGSEIEFDDVLKLHNEISLLSMRVKIMETFSYAKLKEKSNEWYFEMPSKIN